MARRKVAYPYHKLRAGDLVCCDVRGFVSLWTRIVTGGGLFHGGLRRAFDHNWCTHTGMLVQMGGQLFIQEMGRSGVEVNSLEKKYQRWDSRVICFRRLVGINDAKRSLIEARLGEILRRGTEYDYKGILAYIFNRLNQDPGRLYCSEMVYAVTHDIVSPAYTPNVAERPSPQALMHAPQFETIWHR